MDASGESHLVRIGELSRRLGVSDHVLRAWENRYGLLQPVRSTGGFRLYSEADAGRGRPASLGSPDPPPAGAAQNRTGFCPLQVSSTDQPALRAAGRSAPRTGGFRV